MIVINLLYHDKGLVVLLDVLEEQAASIFVFSELDLCGGRGDWEGKIGQLCRNVTCIVVSQ
jgi:hypothetical protein